MSVPLRKVKGLVQQAIDSAVVERGRQRQAAVWCGERPDYLPILLGHTEVNTPGLSHNREWKLAEHILMGGARVPEFFDYPHYSLAEQFDSPEKMLYEFLWETLSWARSGSDAQLTIRPNILKAMPEAFGSEVMLNDASGMYVESYPTKEELRDINPERLSYGNLFSKLLGYTAFFVENAPPGVRVWPADTGGPLTTAQALRGNAIFTDFYDDPEFVCDLLDKCADMCILACRLLKKAVGEEDTSGYHGSLYMAQGSVRVVDDNVVMISPKHHQEFVLPRIRRVFQAFGGGWYHSCGVYEPHLENILSVPEITAINFGNPEQWKDFEGAVRKIINAGKVYYGALPVHNNEDIGHAMRRAMRITDGERKGMIFFLHGDGPWPAPQEIMDLWHKTQDQHDAGVEHE